MKGTQSMVDKRKETVYWNVFLLWVRQNAIRVVSDTDGREDSWTREINTRYVSPLRPSAAGTPSETKDQHTDLINVQQIAQLKKEITFVVDWATIESKGFEWTKRIEEKCVALKVDTEAAPKWASLRETQYPQWKKDVQDSSNPSTLLFVTSPSTLAEFYREMLMIHVLGAWLRLRIQFATRDLFQSSYFLNWAQASTLPTLPLSFIRQSLDAVKPTLSSLYKIGSVEDIRLMMTQSDAFVKDAIFSLHLYNQYLSPRVETISTPSFRQGVVFYTIAYTATSQIDTGACYPLFDVQRTIKRLVKNSRIQRELLTQWLPPYIREVYDVNGKKQRYVRPHDMRLLLLEHLKELSELIDDFETWQKELDGSMSQWEPKLSISTFEGQSLYTPEYAILEDEKQGGMNTRTLVLPLLANSDALVKDLSRTSMDTWGMYVARKGISRSRIDDDKFLLWLKTDRDGKELSLRIRDIIQVSRLVICGRILFSSPSLLEDAWERFQSLFYCRVRDAPYAFISDTDHQFTTHFLVALILYSICPPHLVTYDAPMNYYWKKIWDICQKANADCNQFHEGTGGLYYPVVYDFVPAAQAPIATDLLLYLMDQNELLTIGQWRQVWKANSEAVQTFIAQEAEKDTKESEYNPYSMQRYLRSSRIPNALVGLVYTLQDNTSLSKEERMSALTSNAVFLSVPEKTRDETVNLVVAAQAAAHSE